MSRAATPQLLRQARRLQVRCAHQLLHAAGWAAVRCDALASSHRTLGLPSAPLRSYEGLAQHSSAQAVISAQLKQGQCEWHAGKLCACSAAVAPLAATAGGGCCSGLPCSSAASAV